MDRKRIIYQIAFASIRGMTVRLADELLSRFESVEQFFDFAPSQICALTGLSNRVYNEAYQNELLARAEREADFITSNNINTVFYKDPAFPERLLQVDDAPLLIYTFGKLNLNGGVWLSVVGTRHATPYGIDFTERLIADLSAKVACPVVIVSGLAFGIDVTAHRAALEHGLPTVAVLAHGLNTIYPSQHRSVASKIVASGGMLVTEYSSAHPVHKGNFLARNRIVAALSDALVVSESAEKGGALVTARLSFDYQRDVFALPGRISDRYSRGCNNLIANSTAALIQDADQLIDAMQWPRKEAVPEQPVLFQPDLSPEEQNVVDYLTGNPDATINDISVRTNITVGRLTAMLINLEFRSVVLKYPGGRYRLA